MHDVCCYANLLYMTGQYHRALHHLKAHHIDRVGTWYVMIMFVCALV